MLAYPLVMTSQTSAPLNTLLHRRDTPDTLRISAWLDLDRAAEPIVVVIPPTHGRYYAVWLRDAWNRLFASVGARTHGTAPQALGLLGPGRHDDRLPPGLTPIAAPTRSVRLSGCLEAVGEPDHEVRRGFALLPLSRWPTGRAPRAPFTVAARAPVEQMDARTFFAAVSRLVEDNPPDAETRAALTRLRRLGAWDTLTPEQRASLEHGVQRGRAAIRAEAQRPPGAPVGRWRIGYEDHRSADPPAGRPLRAPGQRRRRPAAHRPPPLPAALRARRPAARARLLVAGGEQRPRRSATGAASSSTPTARCRSTSSTSRRHAGAARTGCPPRPRNSASPCSSIGPVTRRCCAAGRRHR